MSWDRVIQDSDEDEPFAEDDVPTSVDPIQRNEPAPQLDPHHHPENHPAHQRASHIPGQINTPEVQLDVDFDQFLQSQNNRPTSVTSSQQKREERWIPSTGDGGESIGTGAMMTEIGLAQQRLFDDDGSHSANNNSMSTTYPSGISEPCSFPMHDEHPDRGAYVAPTGPAMNIPHEATQLITPHIVNGYEYSTPANSSHVDSPITNPDQTTTVDTSVHPNETTPAHLHKPAQRSKSMYTEWNSPHDTEPNSSVRSPQLNRSKSDHGRTAPMSPRSPASTHDELSVHVPIFEIAPPDIASVVKKRGRPKKQALPQYDDEDDELALDCDSDIAQNKAEKRRPGRPSKPKNPTSSKAAEVDESIVQESSTRPVMDRLEAVEVSEQQPQENKPMPKKKKIKRSKTAPETSQKKPPDDDDDVIWVESRPLETENTNTKVAPLKESGEDLKTSEQVPKQIPSDEPVETSAPAPAPKKRGRKRKIVEEKTETPPVPKEPEPETAEEKTVIPETTEHPTPAPDAPEDDGKEGNTTVEASESKDLPENPVEKEASGSLPQTPNLAKPRKLHSPISSTSKVPYRIGLSKRARIAPLLKVVRK